MFFDGFLGRIVPTTFRAAACLDPGPVPAGPGMRKVSGVFGQGKVPGIQVRFSFRAVVTHIHDGFPRIEDEQRLGFAQIDGHPNFSPLCTGPEASVPFSGSYEIISRCNLRVGGSGWW